MSFIKGIIFDIDGTLLDSNDAHAQAWVDVFAVHGYDVTYAQARSLVGMGSDNLLPSAIHVESDSPLGKQIDAERAARFKDHYLPNVLPFRGARELFERLHGDGIMIIVATSAKEEEANEYLNRVAVAHLVDVLSTSSDAGASKPAPDIVQAALAKSHIRADEVLMIGDTPYDIEAAARAGVRTVAVTCGGWEREALKSAAAVYEGPEDLLNHYADIVSM